MKIIIGLAGEIASGKGTLAQYISKKYNGKIFKLSGILQDVLERVYLEKNRGNLQKISTALRKYFGEDIISAAVSCDIKKEKGNMFIIDGIRRKEDFKHLVRNGKFKLIYIETDFEKRFERIKKRKDKNDDSKKTLESFRSDNRKEAETRIKDLKKKADFIIENNGNIKDLYALADKIIKKIKGK